MATTGYWGKNYSFDKQISLIVQPTGFSAKQEKLDCVLNGEGERRKWKLYELEKKVSLHSGSSKSTCL